MNTTTTSAAIAQAQGRGVDGGEARQEDQLGRLPAIERQFHHALVVDHLANASGVRLHHGGVGGDRHLLTHHADGQRDVDLGIRADLQHDAILHIGREALERHFQLIGTNRQIRQDEPTLGARHGAAHRTRVDLGNRDIGARQGPATGVAHDARHLRAGHRLGRGRRVGQRRQQDCAKTNEQSFQLNHIASLKPSLTRHAGRCR